MSYMPQAQAVGLAKDQAYSMAAVQQQQQCCSASGKLSTAGASALDMF
jgi:hypothetical protein